MTPTLLGVDPRLQQRYQRLVREHTGQAQPTAAGPRTLPSPAQAKAHTQAAWRFFHNRRLRLPQLLQPLLELARQQTTRACAAYGLVVHDWSGLNYSGHTAKKDRIRLAGDDAGLGYELYTALLLGDRDGRPVAPVRLRLRSQGGVHDSARRHRRPRQPHLDGLIGVFNELAASGLPRPLVHLVDAEGDSVYHLRRWQRDGHTFLVRSDEQRVVRWGGHEWTLPEVATRLRQRGAFAFCRQVRYHGRRAQQYVAEAAVVLHRPAWRLRWPDGHRQRFKVPGRPLPLRLVVSEVRSSRGAVLARWLLWSNVPARVPASTLALWYYWRWQVESYFKLLKSAGQQVEHWQQEDAAAVVRRLLVASMACALVWRLARSEAAPAWTARRLLQRLSGRQVAWGREFTEESLLAGLWVLLAMVEVLREHSPQEVQHLADFILADSG
jgi:hypothetical protein